MTSSGLRILGQPRRSIRPRDLAIAGGFDPRVRLPIAERGG